jgi:acetyl-CoA carboxylase biotin carboxyl carrier protein
MTDCSIIQRAIANARALLDTMASSDLLRLHVSSGGTDIFISRHAEPSPLLATQEAPAEAAAVSTVERPVMAPHVATLIATAAIDEQVKAGQTVAMISVLDAEESLSSPVSGRVARIEAATGELIEYGQLLLVIEEAA